MLTLKNIYDRMMELRNPSQYPIMNMIGYDTSGMVGFKSVMHKFQVRGESTTYLADIEFFGLTYTKDKIPGYIPIKILGEQLYYSKPSYSNTGVELKCSCPDFRFMWEYALFKNNSLVGQFRKYTRVPGSTRPPKNPNDVPGVCKHLNSAIKVLFNSGLLDK